MVKIRVKVWGRILNQGLEPVQGTEPKTGK
jgi:hypothetical protein